MVSKTPIAGSRRPHSPRPHQILAGATLALLLLASATGCGSSSARADTPAEQQAGEKLAGVLRAPLLDGGEASVPLAGRDRPLLLVFWASWCKPCNREAPAVVRLARAEGERLDVLGVTVDTERDAARGFVEKYGVPYRSIFDPEMALSDRFGVTATPVFLLVGPDGRKLGRAERLADLRPQLEAALSSAPAHRSGDPSSRETGEPQG